MTETTARMTNTLGLDDLGLAKIIQMLETSFGLTISDAAAIRCRAVGDLETIVRGGFSSVEAGKARCATAMAFHRLRRALVARGVQGPLKPKTRLDGITAASGKQVLKELSRESGLILPRAEGTWIRGLAGRFVIFGFIAAIPTPLVMIPFGLGAVAGGMVAIATIIVLGIVLDFCDPGRLPANCQTMAGLSRKIAGLNFGALHAQGAKARDEDLWKALVEVLSEWPGHIAKADINRQTMILEDDLPAEDLRA